MNTSLHFWIAEALLVFIFGTAGFTNLFAQESREEVNGYYLNGVWQEGSAPDLRTPESSSVPSLASNIIDFDDEVAFCEFIRTVALREKYAAQGVHFDGPGKLDGGGIVHKCAHFGVYGYSDPNFLAFNVAAFFADSGSPRPPETISFDFPVSNVEAKVGSSTDAGSDITMTAFDGSGSEIGSTTVTLGPVLQLLRFSADGILSVEISTTASMFVLDDLGFDLIPCEDIAQFKGRCRPGGLVQAKATFTDLTHVGDTVEISVDNFPYEVPVGSNGQATFSQAGFSPGAHTVELTNPWRCFPGIVVTCPAGAGLEFEEEWDETWEAPTTTALLGNYPNPFNPSTTFRYGLSEPGQVSLKIYNMLGQLVRTVVEDYHVEGYYEAVWDGRNDVGATVSSGIYIYRMTTRHTDGGQAGSFVETKRMLLLK